MPQDEDLDLFRCIGAGTQHHPAQELREHLVDQRQRHKGIMPGQVRRRIGRSAPADRVSGTYTLAVVENGHARGKIVLIPEPSPAAAGGPGE
jgi:hypothetical protein